MVELMCEKGLIRVKTSGLKRGQVVSQEGRKAVVTEWGGENGQRCIFRETFYTDYTSISYIENEVLGWRMEDEIATEEEITSLERKYEARVIEMEVEESMKEHEREQALEKGKAMMTQWPEAAIIAELRVEYRFEPPFGDYVTLEREVVLSWSDHPRDLFPEMRIAAAKFEETKHLAIADPESEHREKYSMGGGYYLEAPETLTNDGDYRVWSVRKRVMGAQPSDRIALLLGRGHFIDGLELGACINVPVRSRLNKKGIVTEQELDKLVEQLNILEKKRFEESDRIGDPDIARWKDRGKKFIAVDIGNTGRWLIEKATGEIYNIKGYGIPDYNKKKKRNLGNIATVGKRLQSVRILDVGTTIITPIDAHDHASGEEFKSESPAVQSGNASHEQDHKV